MADLGLDFYLVAGFAVLLTGISKSGFAGGLGVLAVPMMSLFTTPQIAVAVLMPILTIMDIAVVWGYRRNWSRAVIAALLPGAVLGIGLGALSFGMIDPDWLRIGIGAMALAFVAHYLLGQRKARPPAHPAVVFCLGTLSGFSSFVAHAGAPPMKGYLLAQRLEKSEFVGTNGMFFFIVNGIKAVVLVGMGGMTTESLGVSLMLVPALVLGIGLGFVIHGLINQTYFVRLAYGLLALSGLRLLADPFF